MSTSAKVKPRPMQTPSQRGGQHSILGRIRLGTAEDDAVYNDQRQEQAERDARLGTERLQSKVDRE